MAKTKKKTPKRSRNFCCLWYPKQHYDPIAKCWVIDDLWHNDAGISLLDVIEERRLRAYISPPHDSDYTPTGEQKKIHFHVVIVYDSLKTVEQFLEFVKECGGVAEPGRAIVDSLRGAVRYLCHLDYPDKHRYNEQDVICLGGADYQHAIHLASDDDKTGIEVRKFIRDYDFYYFCDLQDYADYWKPEWNIYLTAYASKVVSYLKSREKLAKDRNSCVVLNHIDYHVNLETGEMIADGLSEDNKKKNNKKESI